MKIKEILLRLLWILGLNQKYKKRNCVSTQTEEWFLNNNFGIFLKYAHSKNTVEHVKCILFEWINLFVFLYLSPANLKNSWKTRKRKKERIQIKTLNTQRVPHVCAAFKRYSTSGEKYLDKLIGNISKGEEHLSRADFFHQFLFSQFKIVSGLWDFIWLINFAKLLDKVISKTAYHNYWLFFAWM